MRKRRNKYRGWCRPILYFTIIDTRKHASRLSGKPSCASPKTTLFYDEFLFATFMSAVQCVIKADAAKQDVQLRSRSTEKIANKGHHNKRALQSSTVRSFDITVTFINSINLIEGTSVDITFDGTSGPVGTFTVTAPAPGETEFFDFCLDAAGESEITAGSDSEDTVLVVVSTFFLSH